MRLGFRLPTAGNLPSTLGVGAMARAAEAAGAESLWVGDHIVWVADDASPYPYSPDGRPPKLLPQTPFYEALTAMTWIAANTTCFPRHRPVGMVFWLCGSSSSGRRDGLPLRRDVGSRRRGRRLRREVARPCRRPQRPWAPAIGPDTIVCTLQNGLGNIEAIERHVAPERIVYGVTGIGAILLGAGEIQLTEGAWTGGGVTWIGARTAAAREVVAQVGELLNRARVTTEVRDDIDALVWNKLAMATAMSSVTAVTRLRMGAVMETPGTRQLLITLTEEIVAVANGKGIALDAAEAVRRNLHIYEQGREHLTSMVQDVIAERRTEVASLTRAIADEGRAVGVPTPACEALASLIEAIEGHYAEQLLPARVSA